MVEQARTGSYSSSGVPTAVALAIGNVVTEKREGGRNGDKEG